MPPMQFRSIQVLWFNRGFSYKIRKAGGSVLFGPPKTIFITRMHSSWMRTARSLTMGGVPGGEVPAWGVYLPVGCTWKGGVSGWGGGYLLGDVPARGMYLPGGTCPGRSCTCLGVPGGGVPVQGGTCPGTPPCRQNSWHTLLKILPCPNFVAGGKDIKVQGHR